MACAPLRSLWGQAPRILATLNIVAFIGTLTCVAVLASRRVVELCPSLVVAIVVAALVAGCGHVLVTYVLSPSLLSNAWPYARPVDDDFDEKVGGSVNDDYAPAADGETFDDSGAALLGGAVNGGTALRPRPSSPSRCLSCARILLFTVTALSVAALYALCVAYAWLESATVLPRGGALSLPGLASAVRVTFSADSIPHIQAASEADLYFAQGVVHARLRLWQLEFQRRVGSGTLSAAVGSGGRDVDRVTRTLGVYAAAKRDYAAMPPGSAPRAALESYAAGVNAFVADSVRSSAYLPLEFRALGLSSFAPWTPPDSLVWSKLMSWDLSGNLDNEALRWRLRFNRSLSAERVDALLPPFDVARFPTILEEGEWPEAVEEPERNGAFPNAPPGRDAFPASSRFGAHMLSGSPTLLDARLERELLQLHRAAAGAAPSGESPTSPTPPSPSDSRVHALLAGAHAAVSDEIARRGANGGSDWRTHVALGVLSGVQAAGDILLHSARALGCVRGACGSVCSESAPGAARSLRSRSQWRGGHVLRAEDGHASNDWVIAGSRTATKMPILANDPHLGLTAPSVWILNALTAPGIECIGASFAGLPGIVIGRNANISWGVTNTGVDVQDLYVIEDDPSNPDHYKVDGVSLPYSHRAEVIKVAGADDLTIDIRETIHGPVVSDRATSGTGIVNAALVDSGVVFALRWVSIDASITDTTFAAFYGLQKAATWVDFRRALSNWTAPSQNVVYADRKGNVGYQMPGWIPTRDLSIGYTGAWPVPGNASAYSWRTPWSFDNLPRVYNPARGFVATANNQVPPNSTTFNSTLFLSADWDEGSDGYRAKRITELINASGTANTVESVTHTQTDYTSLFARDMARTLAAVTDADVTTDAGRSVRDALAAWSGECSVGSTLASVWAAMLVALSQLGAPETGGAWGDPVFLLNALAPGSADPACALSPPYTTCAAFAGAALDAVGARYGASPAAPTGSAPAWGNDVHRVLVSHQVLSSSVLACVADRVVAHGGDAHTVNVGGFALDNDMDANGAGQWAQHAGPSVRHVMDLGDAVTGGESRWIMPMGNDGDILSPQYDTLLSRWARGEYLLMQRSEGDGGPELSLQPVGR